MSVLCAMLLCTCNSGLYVDVCECVYMCMCVLCAMLLCACSCGGVYVDVCECVMCVGVFMCSDVTVSM